MTWPSQNENGAVFEQKDPLDLLALDADNAALDDEVMQEAETAAVEGDSVDFPEVDLTGRMRRLSAML